jgi:protein-S-isoprenylcysteine O-methyltransferase Ste14
MYDVTASLARLRALLAEALARKRVPLGFAAAVLVLWLAKPTQPTLVAGGLLAAVGEALRIWAAGHLNKSREVTSSGPYRWFAHPLYVGSSIMGAGLAIASSSVTVAVVIATYLGSTITAAMRSEEAYLRGRFGDGYDRYRQAGNGAAAENLRRFSVTQALANREHRAVAGLAVAILLLLLKATYNDAFWRTAGTRFVRPGG